MKVLVTGSSGFIGQHMDAALEARGERRVPDPRLSKWTKYTRRYAGLRSHKDRALVAITGEAATGAFCGTGRVSKHSPFGLRTP